MNTGRPTDPTALAFARGALTRRDLLRRAGVAGGVLAGSGLLAACGSGGSSSGSSAGGTAAAAPSVGTTPADMAPSWTFSNWPLYIDTEGKTKHPSLDQFDKAFTTTTKYLEDIEDNESFFGQVKAQLEAGQDIKRDIVVLTDWMAGKWILLGYAEKLDKSALPNVTANQLPAWQGRPIDKGDEYLVPWQSGMTGIGYNPKLTGGKLTSVKDLWNPEFKGKVTLLTEMRDTVPLVMKCQGVDLNKATEQDWLNAIDKLKQAADSGQIRRFTGNDYARDLTSGDVDAVIGWSGDAIQLQQDNPDIQFVMPKEGCMLWSDNMVIPVGAPNPTAAEAWMNYVYDPKNQAQITDYNYYFSPVSGVKQILQKQDPPAAKSDLIFPTKEFTAKCDAAPELTGEEEQKVTAAFNAVVNG